MTPPPTASTAPAWLIAAALLLAGAALAQPEDAGPDPEAALPYGYSLLPALVDPSSPLGEWHAAGADAARLGLWDAVAPGETPRLILAETGVIVAWSGPDAGPPPRPAVGLYRIGRGALVVRRSLGDRLVERRLELAVDGRTLTLTPPDGPPVTLSRGLHPPGAAPDDRHPWRYPVEDECRMALRNRYPLLGPDGAAVGALDVGFDGALTAEVDGEAHRGALRLAACERQVGWDPADAFELEGLGRACETGSLPDRYRAIVVTLRGALTAGDDPDGPRLGFEATAIGERMGGRYGGYAREGIDFRAAAGDDGPHLCLADGRLTLAPAEAPCPRPLRIGAPEKPIEGELAWLFRRPPACVYLPELARAAHPGLAGLAGDWMSDRRAAGALALRAVDTLPARHGRRARHDGFPGGFGRVGVPLFDGTGPFERDRKVIGWRLDPHGLGWLIEGGTWAGDRDGALGATPDDWTPRAAAPDFVWAVAAHPDGGRTLRIRGRAANAPRLEGRLWPEGDHMTLTAIVDGARWLWRLQRGTSTLLQRVAPFDPLPVDPLPADPLPAGPGQPPWITRHLASAPLRWRLDPAATARMKGAPTSLPPFAAVLDDPRSAGHPVELTLDGRVFVVRAGPVQHTSLATRLGRDGHHDRYALLTIIDNQAARAEISVAYDGPRLGRSGAQPRARLLLDGTEVAAFDVVPRAASVRGGL